MGKDILNIYCPSCGGPAKYDIVNQVYRCGYCGGQVQVEEVARSKKEMQEQIARHLEETVDNYALEMASCSGCGATLVFEENEALSTCAFCGRSLVRGEYTTATDMPQSIIPFALTKEEAAQKLLEWCRQNEEKKEARKLKERLPDLKGFYLPYQLVCGPVRCTVQKKGETNRFVANGYLTDEFINCSKQLDNQLLDAMEPYDLKELKPFDFAYVAGQRVKISDIAQTEIHRRLEAETSGNYRQPMEKMWGTRAITLQSDVQPTVELPVLLPVYYIADGDVHAAINGQTGKVSVRAEKETTYVEMPWWLKGLGVLLLALGSTFLAMWLSMRDMTSAMGITGMLGVFYMIVFACMFENTGGNLGSVTKYREVFTTGESLYRRERGKLVLREEALKRKMTEPVFMHQTEDGPIPVTYRFRSWERVLRMVILSFVVTFLPVIVALILNGFNFSAISLSGSAVWFCIAVPVVPIYFILFGIKSLYEKPWMYRASDTGKARRYRGERKERLKDAALTVKLLATPKGIGLFLLIVLIFCVMVYLTGFDTKP